MNEFIEKIRALLNKTVENGCTEPEADAALTKALELMTKYGVTVEQINQTNAAENQFEWTHVQERPRRRWINIDAAIVYDIETLCNCFTLDARGLFSDWQAVFEISEFRDDRQFILTWFEHWRISRTPMIGFNVLEFDYPVLHFLWQNPGATVWDIYDKAQDQIHDHTKFKSVRPDECFAPQIDLLKINHFDNNAKRTSLKALEVNMRSETVLEMPLPWDKPIAPWDIDKVLIPYGSHDTSETKKFALFNMDAIKFRIGLMDTIKGDVLNWNDTKIGAKILEQRLGDELCYTYENGYRQMRQSPRTEIPLADIIFPYVRFTHPEFVRVLNWMRGQVLRSDDLKINEDGTVAVETDEGETQPVKIKTKGVFKGVSAHVGGMDFIFGTGGIHGSVDAQVIVADDETMIRDIDVASLYPNIAIVNRLYPEHLGERFVEEYARLPQERKEWQKKKGKKCVEANAMKLASNGTYGKSNSAFSVFYDPKFTMAITINGQLLLCMLAEWLLTVPSLRIIQINTDGITYTIKRAHLAQAQEIEKAWQAYTRLVLEDVEYSKMWIRDVNNYIAQPADGSKAKQKGAYWYPIRFPEDISESQPPAWHKDFSNIISQMAAVEFMTKGTPIERTILDCADPFLFMLRAKVIRSYNLFIGETEVQRITRYYIAGEGGPLRKIMPAKGPLGTFKRKNGITDHEYHSILETLLPGTHDPRIHTKNKSVYEIRETSLQSGFLVANCSRASDFDFNNVNYEFYIREAEKLVIK